MSRSLASKIEAANLALLVEGRVDAVDEFFAADYVGHGTDRQIGGHGAIRKFVRELHGAFRGFPATGRRVVWRDMVASRFRGGRIVEDWVITDMVERLLGARKRRAV